MCGNTPIAQEIIQKKITLGLQGIKKFLESKEHTHTCTHSLSA